MFNLIFLRSDIAIFIGFICRQLMCKASDSIFLKPTTTDEIQVSLFYFKFYKYYLFSADIPLAYSPG